eukprot:5836152-Alexandrium_andersonii.AAC.1
MSRGPQPRRSGGHVALPRRAGADCSSGGRGRGAAKTGISCGPCAGAPLSAGPWSPCSATPVAAAGSCTRSTTVGLALAASVPRRVRRRAAV